jgi:hypothetical protein
MTDPQDNKRFDFATRGFEQKGRAEAHRLPAELATDPAMTALHTGAAATYEAIANDIDGTAKRIADIDRATARVRTRIQQLSCCRFHGHRVKVDEGTGDWRWDVDGLIEHSSSRR